MAKAFSFILEKFLAAGLTVFFFYGLCIFFGSSKASIMSDLIEYRNNHTLELVWPERQEDNTIEPKNIIFEPATPDSSRRTDRHANPSAMIWTPEVEEFFLTHGYDVQKGEAFPRNMDYFTLDMTKVPDPIQATIEYIDQYTFYTPYGKRRWSHTALPNSAWQKLTNEEKRNVVNVIYNRENGTSGLVFNKQPNIMFTDKITGISADSLEPEIEPLNQNTGISLTIFLKKEEALDQYSEYSSSLPETIIRSYVNQWGTPLVIRLDDNNWHLALRSPQTGQRVLYLSSQSFKVADDKAEARWKASPNNHSGFRYMNGEANGNLKFRKDREDTVVYVWIKS